MLAFSGLVLFTDFATHTKTHTHTQTRGACARRRDSQLRQQANVKTVDHVCGSGRHVVRAERGTSLTRWSEAEDVGDTRPTMTGAEEGG